MASKIQTFAPISAEVPATATPVSASLPAPAISNPAPGMSSNEGTSNLVDPLAGIATNVQVKSDKDYHESVGLKDMTVSSVMDRRALVNSVNWETSVTRGGILQTGQFPRVLISSTSFPARDLLKIHEYFSAKALEFTVQTSASPFSVGALQLLWYPGHTINTTTLAKPGDPAENIKSHTGENMVDTYSTILQIGNGNTATLTVPMTNVLSVLRNKYPLINWTGSDEQLQFREQDWNLWGTFQIRVWNQLQGATTEEDQFLPVKTWVRVIDPYIALLRNPVDNITNEAVQTEGIVMGVAAAVGGAIAAGATAAAPAIGTAAAMGAAGLVTAGAGALIDKVGKHCTYYSEVGESPMVMNMALTNDHRSIISMGYDRKDFHDSHVDLKPTPSEYDMKFIASRRSRIAIVKWTSDATGSTALYKENIYPWMGIQYAEPDFTPMIRVSNLNFAALMFGYWRGSITVTVEVVGNAFTRGALLIHYQPKGDTVVTNDIIRITSYPHTVLNISDVRTVALRIPYNAVTPWSRVGKLNVDNPRQPVVEAEDTLGSIYFRVLNPLRTKGPTDISSLDINVYVHSDDMDFRYPYLNRGIAATPGKIVNTPFTEMMTDALGPEVIEAENFGPASDPTPTRLMPTQHTDLAQLLTRRVPIHQIKIASPYTRVRIPIPAIGLRDGQNLGTTLREFATPNFYNLLAQAFAYQTGSQTLSLMNFGTTSQKCAVVAQIIYTGDEDWDDRFTRDLKVDPSTEEEFRDAATEDACIMMNMSVNSRQELGIPWYDILQMLPSMVQYQKLSLGENTTSAFMPFAVIDLYINAVVGITMQISSSVGPNFQFSQFLGAPTLALYNPIDTPDPVTLKRSNAFRRKGVKKPVVKFNPDLHLPINPDTEGGRPKKTTDEHACAYCPSKPKSFLSYIRHLESSHMDSETARTNEITCAYCGKKGSPLTWDLHNRKCGMRYSHRCAKHDLTFIDGEKYLNHLRSSHGRTDFLHGFNTLTGTGYPMYPSTEMFSGFQAFSDMAQQMSSIKENVADATMSFTLTSEKIQDSIPSPEKIDELIKSSTEATEAIATSLPQAANSFDNLSRKISTSSEKITEVTAKISSLIDTLQLALIPKIQKSAQTSHGSTARYIMNWTRAFRTGNIEPIMSDFIIEMFEVFSPIDPGMSALLAKVVLSFFPVGTIIHDSLNALILSSASTFVSPLFEQFKEYFNIPKTEAETSTFTSYANSIFTLIGFGFVVVTGVAAPGDFYKNLKNLFSFINLPRASSSFILVIESIIKIKDWVSLTYFGKDPYAGYEWLDQNKMELLNFQTAYYDFQKYTPTKILNSPVLRNRSIEHGEFAKLLSFNLSKIKTGSNEINMLKQQADYFIALARQARTAPPTKVRTRPTVVTFQGGSQVGKTFVASTALPHYIQQAMDWPKEPVFMVSSSTDDFMSGYSQQMITMIDDLLQMKKGDDLNGFVNMIGNAPYRVNMASLDEKGTQFLSECVIVTMNDPHPKVDKFVTHPDAIYNRLYDHYFSVVPKPGFNKEGRLNTKKVRSQKLVNPDDYLLFYRVTYTRDARTGAMKRQPAVGHETEGQLVTFFDIVREVLASIREEEATAELQNDPENDPEFAPFNENPEPDDDESDYGPEDSDDDIDFGNFTAFTEAFYWNDFEKKNQKNPRQLLLQSIKWIQKFNTKYIENYDANNIPDVPADDLEQLYQTIHYLASYGYSDNILSRMNFRNMIHLISKKHPQRKTNYFTLELEFPSATHAPDAFSWYDASSENNANLQMRWWYQFIDPNHGDGNCNTSYFYTEQEHTYRTSFTNMKAILKFTPNPYLGSNSRDHPYPPPWYWKILGPILTVYQKLKTAWIRFTRVYSSIWYVIRQYLIAFGMSLMMSGVMQTFSAGVSWLLGMHPKQLSKRMDTTNKELYGLIEILSEDFPYLFKPCEDEEIWETVVFDDVLMRRFDAFMKIQDATEAQKRGQQRFREFARQRKEEDPDNYARNLSWMEEHWNSEGFYSAGAPSGGAKSKGKVKLVTPKPGKKTKTETPNTESDLPPMFDILKKNVVRLSTQAGHSIRALAWKQDILIVNRHFMNTLHENEMVEIHRWSPNAYTEQEIKFSIEFKNANYVTMEYEDDNPLDICLWKLGWKQGSFKDISSHFIRDKDFPSVTGQNGFRISNVITTINNMQYVENQVVHDVASGDFINFPVSIVARGETAPGLCGSPWVVTNNSIFGNVGKICGIHSWGITGLIGCTPMSIEALEAVSEGLPMSFTPSVPTMEMSTDENGPTNLIYHKFHGRVPPQKAFIQPRKTEIQPSPICNELFPITHMPAVMSNRDPRLTDPSTFDTNLGRKTDHGTKWFKNPDQIMKAVENLKEDFRLKERDVAPRLLTIDEAINGIDGKAYMEDSGLEMRNSPGYPYNKTTGRGKFPYFEALPQGEGERLKYKISDQALIERLEERETLAKQGIVPPNSIWIDVMKDELRAIAKCKSGSTRIVNAPPLDLMILWNKYFGAFRLMFMNPKNVGVPLESALGVDPKVFWPEIGLKLREARATFGIDYTAFDSSQNAEFYRLIVDIINDWYNQSPDTTSEDNIVRTTMFFEVGHTLHLYGADLYTDDHGLPSGVCGGFTTITNIIVNKIISRVTFQRTGLDVSLYNKYVGAIFMGDDNLQWINKVDQPEVAEALRKYNRVTLAKVAAEIGMVVTMPNKSTDLTEYDEFEDLTFLKCGFSDKVIPGYYLPTMDEKTIHNLLNWYRPKHNPDQFKTNIEEALKFAAPHGKQFYEELASKLRSSDKIRALYQRLDLLIPPFETVFYSTYLPFGLHKPESQMGPSRS